MPAGSSSLRGVQDIRTQAGKVDRTSEPYKAYMKITCLEMERARRSKERESAMKRVTAIDVRMAEMDREKESLLGALGVSADSSDARQGRDARASEFPNEHGFRINY